MSPEPATGWSQDEERDAPSRLARVAWGLVLFLTGAILLGTVTLASIALLSPDAWEGPCKRPQLVRPAPCSPVREISG